MTIAVRYFITGRTGSYIDWTARYAGFALPSQSMVLTGGAGGDSLSVGAGSSVDATNLLGGTDKIYFSGSLAQYTQSVDQSTGIYTFSRVVGERTEVVKVLATNQNDALFFADGHIVFNAATDARLYSNGAFQAIAPEWLVPGGTPSGPVSTAATNETDPVKVFILDSQGAYIPALTQPGQRLVVSGSAGVDKVAVGAGTVVDATNLLAGNDEMYLQGRLQDYSQSIDQATGIYTLTRTVNGQQESLRFVVSNQNDRLFFADGNIVLNAATDPRLYSNGQFQALSADMLQAGGSVTQTIDESLQKIAAYAQDSAQAAPTAQDYQWAGVTGIGGAGQPTVAMVNSALATVGVVGSEADTAAEVQAIVNAYKAVLDLADGNANGGTALSAAQLELLGISGLPTDSTRTLSPYFSSKSAMAPAATASL